MRLQARLDRLSRLVGMADAAQRARVLSPTHDHWPNENDSLATFESCGRAGHFDGEPDFPVALALYRDALATARASVDPPFEPPLHFMPDQRNHQLRRDCWRDSARFPDVWNGLAWLDEMLNRVVDGIPPCSEAEYRELEQWFRANDGRLSDIEKRLPSHMFELGISEWTSCAQIRYGLKHGPRADGTGRLAEQIRQLRTRYGGPS